MAENRSVDDVLTAQLQPEIEEQIEDVKENDPVENIEAANDIVADVKDEIIADENKDDVKHQDNLDDYGNPLPKAKVYTEEEVQNMIRDRLRRGQAAKEQERQVPVEEVKHQEDGNEDWEQQLTSLLDRHIETEESRLKRQQMEAQEKQIQQEFESNFTNGMTKYPDFVDVVSKQPISDSMMIATRSMRNPAAFVYAASKNFPKELERISKISDPIGQMTEIGRLDERMRKVRAGSNAPRPVAGQKGDMPNNSTTKRSVDDLILKDARRKLRR